MTSPALDAYYARTRPAGDRLREALRRNPDDTRAWDEHAAELKAAKADLRRDDPETASEMLAAGMDWAARHGSPPAEDTRTEAQKARDASFGITG